MIIKNVFSLLDRFQNMQNTVFSQQPVPSYWLGSYVGNKCTSFVFDN